MEIDNNSIILAIYVKEWKKTCNIAKAQYKLQGLI